jgi:class 3 adenylate cyclase
VKAFGSYNADEKILREQELADIQLASQHEITREVLAARARIERAKVFAWEEEALRRIAAGETPDPIESHYKADPVIASTLVPIERGQRRQMLHEETCTIFLSDVVQYPRVSRNDRDRLIVRRALLRMTQAALQGIPGAWSEDRGDGLLTIIPSSVSTEEAMEQFLRVLPRELERHNIIQPESGRLKLRVAVNVGPVTKDDLGVSGEAIITAARLVDAPRFKSALAQSASSLGVIASPFIYDTVIRYGQEPDYMPIDVKVKEFASRAWMKLFGPEQPSRRSRGDGVITLRGRGHARLE